MRPGLSASTPPPALWRLVHAGVTVAVLASVLLLGVRLAATAPADSPAPGVTAAAVEHSP